METKKFNSIIKPTYNEKEKVSDKQSHPNVSIGTKEKELLIYLFNNKTQRFNLRDYSVNISKIPRSSVYDYLNKLERLGLVKRELGNNRITEKGLIYLESIGNEYVGGSREPCRTSSNLSTHYHKFKLPILENKNFNISKLKSLNPLSVKENKLHNLHQIIINFNDGTIIINPKQLIINLHDILTDDVTDSDLKCLNRAIEYSKKFIDIGIITEGIFVEEGHWARVDSILSELIHDKVDNKYFLDLGDNKKFWIDHSNGIKAEDETNDKLVRERIDRMLTEISNNDISLLDINKITKALGFITKIESTRLLNEIESRKEIKSINSVNYFKPDYIG